MSSCLNPKCRKAGARQVCGHCHLGCYCNRFCQKEDWLRHRSECERLGNVDFDAPSSSSTLVAGPASIHAGSALDGSKPPSVPSVLEAVAAEQLTNPRTRVDKPEVSPGCEACWRRSKPIIGVCDVPGCGRAAAMQCEKCQSARWCGAEHKAEHVKTKHSARACAIINFLHLKLETEAYNCVNAGYEMGHCYAQGMGVRQDRAAALAWWRKAAEGGHRLAPHDTALAYKNGEGTPENPGEAVRFWQLGAGSGDPSAALELACCYLFGYGVQRDPDMFKQWATFAHERGSEDAPYYLAFEMREGGCLPCDEAESLRLLAIGASRGDARAQGLLGELKVKDGNSDDEKRDGKALLTKAAEGGYVSAQMTLASCYDNGLVDEGPNRERALFWYTQAATNGHPQGQRMLAELLESDNPEQAAHWYLQAAEQGLPHAMRALAGMHCRGVGVKPNVVEACNLLAAAEGTQMCCEASARDVTDCCLWVGQSYLNGESGVKKNVGKARKYLDAAAASGSETAKGILATHRAFKGK